LAMSSAWILIQIRKLIVVDMAGLSDCRDVFPVYIGDDRTDEDAFKVRGILLYMVSLSWLACVFKWLLLSFLHSHSWGWVLYFVHLSISPVFVVNWSQFGYHCKLLGLVMVCSLFRICMIQQLYVESNLINTASNHSKAMHMRTKFAGCK
jgi:hypothetical protein